MDTDNEKSIDEQKPAPKKLLFGRNRAAGVFAFIAAAAVAGATVIHPFLMKEDFYCEYTNYYEGMNDHQAALARAKYCRDSVYSDLCALGSVYLSNCSDGVYGGTREIYESLYSGLSQFDDTYISQAENIFGLKNAGTRAIKIEQSKYTITNIDSDYYYFYVSYGNEYLTNIKDFAAKDTHEETLGALSDRFSEWYYKRDGSTISTKTKYDESGLNKTEVYYTTVGSDGTPALTSEYIDSDKLVFGSCTRDNYGRYTYCFDGNGDRVIPEGHAGDNYQLGSDGSLHITQQAVDEDTGDVIMDGYVDFTIPKTSAEYKLFIAQNGGVYNENGEWLDLSQMPGYEISNVDISKLTVFMSPKTDIVAASESFIGRHRELRTILYAAIVSLMILFCISLPAAVISLAVRRKEKYAADGTPLIYRLFKTDVSLILLGAAGTQLFKTISNMTYGGPDNTQISYLVQNGSLACGAVLVTLLTAGSLIRQLKLHGFREKHDLLAADIWNATSGIRRRTKERFYNSAAVKSFRKLRPVTRHRVRFITVLISGLLLIISARPAMISGDIGLLLLIPLVTVFVISFLAYIISADRTAKDISILTGQTEKMLGSESGEIRTAQNELDISSPMYMLGEKLESVSEAAENAVEERLKSERLKIELVTNVSHDLKTPLTSIISYIDLLSKSELSDEARDYVSILSRKADKLRDIVADVFTLAKAVSGVEVELADLDLAMLARQAAADISDKAETSGRELREDIRMQRAPIVADGSKLYRVIQNLLDNALKYSMEGSRVYMTLTEQGSGYELEVRNICESEPDFTAEEILERFSRGDRSRTDGGSGLGLSIAKSFTEACGGSFEVVIDKDLFTAYVRFPRREEPAPPSDADTAATAED